MPSFDDEPTFGFLSRLCGGEGHFVSSRHSLFFLSRLCGGEVLSNEVEY